MPVKVGNSYVSEAAYNYAQSQVDEESTGGILQDLSSKFTNLKFSTNTAPFSGSGLNNVAISPKILREMETNPDKRLEYEALIYDISTLQINNPTVKAHGAIIDENGGLSMWSISGGEDTKRVKVTLDKDDKKSWWQKLLDKLNEDEDTPAAKVELSTKNTDDKPNGKVAFNASKRARQLAAAKTKSDVRAVIELLQKDLDDCKEGVKNNMCDESEVKKVEDMIERANKRLNEVDDTLSEPSIDIII